MHSEVVSSSIVLGSRSITMSTIRLEPSVERSVRAVPRSNVRTRATMPGIAAIPGLVQPVGLLQLRLPDRERLVQLIGVLDGLGEGRAQPAHLLAHDRVEDPVRVARRAEADDEQHEDREQHQEQAARPDAPGVATAMALRRHLEVDLALGDERRPRRSLAARYSW